MKAARCLPLVWLALACSGGEGGPRTGRGSAGTLGAGASAGTNAVASGGTGNTTGAANNAGSGGVPSAGGTAGSGPSGGGDAGGSGGGGGLVDSGPLARPGQRTVVYLPDYRGALATWTAKIDYSRISYLNLCFANVDAAGNVSYADTGLDTFVAAAHAKGVKVCVAIGGGSIVETGGVYATVLQDATRSTLVNALGQFAVDHQLDCIDVDLEGNGVNQFYEAFVTELATKLHADKKEMTSAVSSWFGDKITDKAIQAFDFMNIMAYDLHNPGGATQPVQSASIADATQEVDYWVGRGLAKSKAVFGVPFYGYRWQGGAKGEALTYAEILAQSPMAATQDQVEIAGNTVYLNSKTTIAAKAVLAKTYGGIMVWELGQDAVGDASLLKAIADVK